MPTRLSLSLGDVAQPENLNRALRWVRGNPDFRYQYYCSDMYSHGTHVDSTLISELQRLLHSGTYLPEAACRVMLPKRGRITRPYTILTTIDQLAYQAFANIVAEALHPHIAGNHYVTIFGNVYAGKTSPIFYRNWKVGQKSLHAAAKASFGSGNRWIARLDLTAFFDTIDHGTLAHFLMELGCEAEFCQVLLRMLKGWATDEGIPKLTGLPQGPVGSAIFSEVILRHIDGMRELEPEVTYLRNCDDILLLGRTKDSLLHIIADFDQRCKRVGVFPNEGKLACSLATDIKDELRGISDLEFRFSRSKYRNQTVLRRTIFRETPRLRVRDDNRLKYLITCAKPSTPLARRLLAIAALRPDFYFSVARHIQQYRKVPRDIATQIADEIERSLSPAKGAAYIRSARQLLPSDIEANLRRKLLREWRNTTRSNMDLAAAAGEWLVESGSATTSQIRWKLGRSQPWWLRVRIIGRLSNQNYSRRDLQQLLSLMLTDCNSEVAIAAAMKAVDLRLSFTCDCADLNPLAAQALHRFGLLETAHCGLCPIKMIVQYVTGCEFRQPMWARVFGRDYGQAERVAVQWAEDFEANTSAFVMGFDVFLDLLLRAIYRHDRSLGKYPGSPGGVLEAKRLAQVYPRIMALVHSFSNLRYENHYSHARQRRTGRRTGPIHSRFRPRAKRLLKSAFEEVAQRW